MDCYKEFEIKNVLITGASSGIGAALAEFYACAGAKNLFLSGRNVLRLNEITEVCKTRGCSVFPKVIDVCNQTEMAQWIAECDKKAELNLVFANAGVSTGEETTENVYNTFNTNVMGVLNTVTPAIELYKSKPRKKQIIAIMSSIAGYHGLPSCPSYSASKACVKAYGEALRGSLKNNNIQVNIICPGFVKSRITDKNACPMPFLMSAGNAAEIIAGGIKMNAALITFPFTMRLAAWLVSILPNCISDVIYAHLPHKV